MFFLDLDNFKTINDHYGHAVGDELLRRVALRLRTHLRESDTFARFSGDEFTILLLDLSEPEQAREKARVLLELLELPFRIREHTITVRASIGISLYPHDGGDANALLERADEAMYRAKHDHDKAFAFYRS